ncbi:MAG: prolyl oligopeptidase family serine peptidase [Trueperaceae bacterium]
MQTPKRFKGKTTKSLELPYLLYLPKNAEKKKLPLVMFLHGSGERGNDLNLLKHNGLPKVIDMPKVIDNGQDFPFIVVSPQCPADSWWTLELEALKGLLESVIKKHNVDTKRVYITGLSMGGMGTWQFAIHYPELVAAILPVCGGGEVHLTDRLRDIPVWAFHGDKDNIVLPEESKRMVDGVNRHGGNAKLTVYKNVGHDSWTKTYNNPKIYAWLLSHVKGRR